MAISQEARLKAEILEYVVTESIEEPMAISQEARLKAEILEYVVTESIEEQFEKIAQQNAGSNGGRR